MKTLLISYLSGICLVLGADKFNYEKMTEQEHKNLDSFMENVINGKATDKQCPTFKCSQEDFDNQVFCHRNNIDNPFDVKLKACNKFHKVSDSDFWGNPTPIKEKLFCHHGLNRCVTDPFKQIVNKLPGDTCINNYECKSNRCEINKDDSGRPISKEEGPHCQGEDVDGACSADQDCSIGLYCDSESNKCEEQKSMSDECTRDFECMNQASCSNGICKQYGTLYNSLESDNVMGCQSGFLEAVDLDGNFKKHTFAKVCFGAPELIPKSKEHPYRCESPDDFCEYEANSPKV